MTNDSANAIIHHVGPGTSVVSSFRGISASEIQLLRIHAWMIQIKRMLINQKKNKKIIKIKNENGIHRPRSQLSPFAQPNKQVPLNLSQTLLMQCTLHGY